MLLINYFFPNPYFFWEFYINDWITKQYKKNHNLKVRINCVHPQSFYKQKDQSFPFLLNDWIVICEFGKTFFFSLTIIAAKAFNWKDENVIEQVKVKISLLNKLRLFLHTSIYVKKIQITVLG